MRRLALVLALAGAEAAAHEGHDHAPATVMSDALSLEQLLLPDIPVTDATGATQGFRTRYGQAGPVLISFLYTECDDTCGMIRGAMQLVDQDLQDPGAPRLTLIAVSVDPARDTPEALALQAAQMQSSARWDWVVASPRDTPALLSASACRRDRSRRMKRSICWVIWPPGSSCASRACRTPTC